uniref:P-type ATPase C-terminal domain-containing protein n=1 Tax=Eptatretus burgeri TaxID=7764 RepID=A0A8C4NCY6_EPTBU
MALWMVFFGFYSLLWPIIPIAPNMQGQARMMYGCLPFWVFLLLIPITCLIPDTMWKILRGMYCPSFAEKIQEPQPIMQGRYGKIISNVVSKSFTERAQLLKNAFKKNTTIPQSKSFQRDFQHGYAFSQEENGVLSQTEIIRAYDTTKPSRGASTATL